MNTSKYISHEKKRINNGKISHLYKVFKQIILKKMLIELFLYPLNTKLFLFYLYSAFQYSAVNSVLNYTSC